MTRGSSVLEKLDHSPVAREEPRKGFEEGPVVRCWLRQLALAGFGWKVV